jgi:hypothetical protein
VSGLITGAGCSKVSNRDNSSLPLLGLSFNDGAFGVSAIATWNPNPDPNPNPNPNPDPNPDPDPDPFPD